MRPQRHQLADPPVGLDALPARDRLRVLAVATEVFVGEGYRATTVDQLRLRIYPRLFDWLFTDKEDCFLQVFDHHIARARQAVSASAPNGDAWPRRLAAGLWALLELIDAEPAAARLVLVESQLATPAAARRYYETVSSISPFMGEGRLLADGSPPPMADSALPGGLASTLETHLSRGGEAPVSDLHGELLRVLLFQYRANPEVDRFLTSEILEGAA